MTTASASSATSTTSMSTSSWEFGAGAVCWGPGTLGGKLLARLSYRDLCDDEWASVKGLMPRLPVEFIDEMDPLEEVG